MHPIHPKQHGIAMIEILGALLIAAMLVAGLASMIDTGLEDAKAQRSAQYQAAMAAAASTYLADQYGALAQPARVGQTIAITPAMLRAAGMLPPGMAPANPYGQSGCLLVRPRVKSAAAPATIVLDALVVSEGTPIPDRVLAFAAASAGAGFISAREPTRAQSAAGAWALGPTTSPTLASFLGAKCSATPAGGGSLVSALFFDGAGQSADFLYRNKVPGMPELNQMNAPIGMGAAAVVTFDDPCSGAAIAVDAERRLMHCNSENRWAKVSPTSSWKKPVYNFADLALQEGNTDGDVRLVKSLGLAFSYRKVTDEWRPLAADQNGNLNIPGTLTAGLDVKAGRDLTAGRNGEIKGDLDVYDHIHGYTLIIDDYIWAATYSIGSHYQPGAGCNKWLANADPPVRVNIIGTIVLDSASPPLPLICTGTDPDNAVWRYIDGSLTR
ncbi:shufflon system plasmid conjugative transfer pilus tip adhesin PilV [Massilia atriviolacea]|uniref:Shufflon system plasmid conjugative transfer pilus tip adhesin PilV n=1 Tax=Massilia atriviolacea TaxID=2495579 RepID=A0A430HU25_9BURK|nr:shufflon system plasmid conjugative transfer pilus tip adhesin PilV [Massilia atriviolacea]RSZ61083.1 shufflon system plasmid conjugative transfer pilus tip adhesin PilV [Massilia atriviolacea]